MFTANVPHCDAICHVRNCMCNSLERRPRSMQNESVDKMPALCLSGDWLPAKCQTLGAIGINVSLCCLAHNDMHSSCYDELFTSLQGIILATRDRFTKDTEGGAYAGNVTTASGYLLSLWLHECRRVFADKLTSHEDKEWVDDTVMKLINENCGPELVSQVCLPYSVAASIPILHKLEYGQESVAECGRHGVHIS